MKAKVKKTCSQGHTFYKRSDCPTCPVCEKLKALPTGFLANLHSPVRNALLRAEIDTLQKLSTYTEREILQLHGIGKTSLPVFRSLLAEQGLAFNNDDTAKLDS